MLNILSSLIYKVRKEFTEMILDVFTGLKKLSQAMKKQTAKQAASLLLLLTLPFVSVSVYAINITVSIPPLAGIIAPLLDENDHLSVILKPGASPHGYQLKPSDLRRLQTSDLIVWVGSPVDSWMQKTVTNLEKTNVDLAKIAGIETYPVRSGGLWEVHHHHHEASEEAEHDQHEHEEHEQEHAQQHNHHAIEENATSMDGHLWMSYKNSLLLVKAVSQQLQQLKPNQTEQIKHASQAWLNKLQQTHNTIKQQLKLVKNEPYLVLHDAYQYFEKEYGLKGVGSIQLNPSIFPSLKRVADIRARIKKGAVKCVFKEPQFPEKRVLAVTRGLTINVGSLDPMGIVSTEFQQKNHQNFMNYDQFMIQLSREFSDCLTQNNE
ncbi:zinc ABC transporter substrate-binding protein [Thiomicrorhabdus sp. Milos-T2]|uniref:zinc ABC transporter substrate-binding protein n=1 Tax=Thiomicrorhabdus sp. Milos-T2 TaxID=90814 RepID=UPI000493E23D|nr:zinc ABC transporter substrate-binding protein [Thiomicrorhabdus sp. Milos-T2]